VKGPMPLIQNNSTRGHDRALLKNDAFFESSAQNNAAKAELLRAIVRPESQSASSEDDSARSAIRSCEPGGVATAVEVRPFYRTLGAVFRQNCTVGTIC
jgi:hypothetical protein